MQKLMGRIAAVSVSAAFAGGPLPAADDSVTAATSQDSGPASRGLRWSRLCTGPCGLAQGDPVVE
jgi:hypothetical protein